MQNHTTQPFSVNSKSVPSVILRSAPKLPWLSLGSPGSLSAHHDVHDHGRISRDARVLWKWLAALSWRPSDTTGTNYRGLPNWVTDSTILASSPIVAALAAAASDASDDKRQASRQSRQRRFGRSDSDWRTLSPARRPRVSGPYFREVEWLLRHAAARRIDAARIPCFG